MGWGGVSECHARSEPGPLDVIIDPLPPRGRVRGCVRRGASSDRSWSSSAALASLKATLTQAYQYECPDGARSSVHPGERVVVRVGCIYLTWGREATR